MQTTQPAPESPTVQSLRRGSGRRRGAAALLGLLIVAGLGVSGISVTHASEQNSKRPPTTLEYNLGARSFSVPNLTDANGHPSPMEVQARVHLPPDAAKGHHPVIVLVPGYWPTCADAKAQKITENPRSSEDALTAAYDRLNRWPCAKGISQIPSYRGFDYLARALSGSGNIVISIGANGANAIDTRSFQGDQARAALIGKHLNLWQKFVATGKGPLSAVLPARIRTHVDMKSVGLLGAPVPVARSFSTRQTRTEASGPQESGFALFWGWHRHPASGPTPPRSPIQAPMSPSSEGRATASATRPSILTSHPR
ncbi:hypothetical protein [Microbacterium oleivorans]|uniref:LPXTG-motif protein cell wall anchor domain protein n=1 Tax=Microbacterium oleivorans TaxID=273677 RepID=A0A031FNI0_9MICO|nr:hypothetical protein [Microbacterium oleivorans]EZP26143.1 LPXTG-motif protein cell wall anchor domain protein [Microbacterium oleivorans]